MTLLDWFEKGMSFETYHNSMLTNKEEVAHVYNEIAFTHADKELFEEIKNHQLRAVVLTADWCGDAAVCVPIFQRMAEQSNISIHYLIRDDNMELMNQYLTNGVSASIPIFIFMDNSGNEQLVWGPRSKEVQQLITSLMATLPPKEDPNYADKQKEMYIQLKAKLTTDKTIWRTVIDSFTEAYKSAKIHS